MSPRRDRESEVDSLVRAYLDGEAAREDGAVGLARVRAALAARPARWQPRLALALRVAAAFAFVMLPWQLARNPVQASSYELVSQAQREHRSSVERCYEVEIRRVPERLDAFPRLAQPPQVRVWTRGDRFWVEMRHHGADEPFVWGRDEEGALWAVLGPHSGIRAPTEQAPPALGLLADVYSLDVATLLDNVLRDCSMTEDDSLAGSAVRVVRAEPRSPQTRLWLGHATLEIDEAKVLRRLTIARNRMGEPFAEAVFRLTQTRPADETKYRLEGHLSRPFRVHEGPGGPVEKQKLLARYLGQKKSSEPKVELKDVDGQAHAPLAQPEKKATVLFFLMPDCPISNAYAPEIRRICETYGEKKVGAYVVHADPDVKAADAKAHAKDYGLPCPVLLDPTHALAKRTGVTTAPEVAVIAEGKVVYRGRIDDWYVDYGKRRSEPTVRDLRDGLDDVLSGKPVARPATKALGCPLPEPRK